MNAVLPLKTRDAGRTPRGLPVGRIELTGRAAALAEIDEHLNNLTICLHWLIEQGFVVISVDMRRGKAKPQVQVAPSPRLHVLFKDDCANIGRRQDGALTFFAWIGIRFGCEVRWEEVTCA